MNAQMTTIRIPVPPEFARAGDVAVCGEMEWALDEHVTVCRPNSCVAVSVLLDLGFHLFRDLTPEGGYEFTETPDEDCEEYDPQTGWKPFDPFTEEDVVYRRKASATPSGPGEGYRFIDISKEKDKLATDEFWALGKGWEQVGPSEHARFYSEFVYRRKVESPSHVGDNYIELFEGVDELRQGDEWQADGRGSWHVFVLTPLNKTHFMRGNRYRRLLSSHSPTPDLGSADAPCGPGAFASAPQGEGGTAAKACDQDIADLRDKLQSLAIRVGGIEKDGASVDDVQSLTSRVDEWYKIVGILTERVNAMSRPAAAIDTTRLREEFTKIIRDSFPQIFTDPGEDIGGYPWACSGCSQVNSSWARECGRCEAARDRAAWMEAVVSALVGEVGR